MRTGLSMIVITLLAVPSAAAQDEREAENADQLLSSSLVVAPAFESAALTVTPGSSDLVKSLLVPPLSHSARVDGLLPPPEPAPMSSGTKALLAIGIPLVVLGVIALTLALWPQGE